MQIISPYIMPIMVVFSLSIIWFIGARGVAQIMGSPMGASIMSSKQAVVISAIFGLAGVLLSGHIVTHSFENMILADIAHEPLDRANSILIFVATTFIWMFIAARKSTLFSFSYTVVCSLIASCLFGLGYESINWTLVTQIVSAWLLSPFICYFLTTLVYRIFRNLILQREDPTLAMRTKGPLVVSVFVTLFCFTVIYGGISFLAEPLPIYTWIVIPCFVGGIFYFLSAIAIKKVPSLPIDDSIMVESNTEGLVRPLAFLIVFVLPFSLGANNVANGVGPLLLAFKMGVLDLPVAIQNSSGWLLLISGLILLLGLGLSGLRLMGEMGRKFTELTPMRSFSIITATSLTIIIGTSLGIPLSTFHIAAGGVLAFSHMTALYRETGRIECRRFLSGYFIPWFITIPGTICIAGMLHLLVRLF